MDNKVIIKRINDAIVNLEGVPAMTHNARKRMVIAEEKENKQVHETTEGV